MVIISLSDGESERELEVIKGVFLVLGGEEEGLNGSLDSNSNFIKRDLDSGLIGISRGEVDFGVS